MLKYVASKEVDDPTHQYPESYKSLTSHCYRGKDIDYITNQIDNMHQSKTRTDAHVVVAMLGTNNVVGEQKCSDSDFVNFLDRFIEVVLKKYPKSQLFLLPILPRFDVKMGYVNSTIKRFNSIIANRCNPKSVKSFQFLESMFRPGNCSPSSYLARDKLHLSFNGNKLMKNVIKANLHQWSSCWLLDGEYHKVPSHLRYLVQPNLITVIEFGVDSYGICPDSSDIGLWDNEPHYGCGVTSPLEPLLPPSMGSHPVTTQHPPRQLRLESPTSLSWLKSRLSYTPSFSPDNLPSLIFQYLLTMRREFVPQGRFGPKILLFGPHKYVYNNVSASLQPVSFDAAPL